MTDERIAIEALSRCRFMVGSWSKRFARDLAAMPENQVLTPKQRLALWRTVKKFRRQLHERIVKAADEWLNLPEQQLDGFTLYDCSGACGN